MKAATAVSFISVHKQKSSSVGEQLIIRAATMIVIRGLIHGTGKHRFGGWVRTADVSRSNGITLHRPGNAVMGINFLVPECMNEGMNVCDVCVMMNV